MSLRRAPLLLVFYETSQIRSQRRLFESVIGVPVIEVEPHLPHHRHGVFKYDGGGVILSHNMSGPSRFRPAESDALVTVFGVPPGWPVAGVREFEGMTERADGLFTDAEGRHFRFVPTPGLTRAVVDELRLTVDDLEASVAFYRDHLDLELLERTEQTARFATGTVALGLAQDAGAPDGREPRRHSYLLVFHAAEIEKTRQALIGRGLEFKGPRVGFSEIGGTIRFDDPSGQRFCLYVPSEESLSWGSGPKVLEIAGGHPAAR
jgi:catechol 2,3-dioxygenase-like lactoylglutathione lyase family enzyme